MGKQVYSVRFLSITALYEADHADDLDKGLHIIYWGNGAGNIVYGAKTFL